MIETIMGDDATIPNDAGAPNTPFPPTPAAAGESQTPLQEGTPPAPAPAPPQPPTAPQAGISPQNAPDPASVDMAKILDEVKLPERHTVPDAASRNVPSKTYDTALVGGPQQPTVPANPPAAPQDTTDTPAPAPKDNLSSLHTLKDDLQHVVQENKISYVRAVALQEEKRQKNQAFAGADAPKRKRMTFALFITILLFVAGVLALGAVFTIMQQRAGQASTPLAAAILFAEQTVPFPLDNETPADILRTLASARTSGALTLGAILQIVPVYTTLDPASGQTAIVPATFGEFLAALGTRAPDDLARALADDFFFGIHTVDENAPLFVIPVTSYERAFAAMLAWEPTMNADLAPLFTPLPRQAVGPDGLPVERKFADTVMRNYDVRALRDDNGIIELYYSFPTRNILIIAESPYSFTEILTRLRADRRL